MATSKFCTIADVKAYLNAVSDFTQDDAQIEVAIKSSTELIRQYTRRQWDHATYIDFFDAYDVNYFTNVNTRSVVFYLSEKPLDMLAPTPVSIKLSSTGNFDNATEILPPELFQVDYARNRLILFPHRMYSFDRSIKVTYVAGFKPDDSDPDLLQSPENIRSACAINAAFMVRRIWNATQGSSKKADRAGSREFTLTPQGLIREAQALVKSEVRLMVGGNGS